MLALSAGLTVDRFRSTDSTDAPVSRQFAKGYATPTGDEQLTLAQRVFDDAVPAVVLVSALDAQGKRMKRGSGFFLYPGDRLVTCEHVIAGAERVIIDTYWRRRLTIDKVLARDERLDLAILPVPRAFRPDVLKLSDRPLSEGETVFCIGSPAQTKFGISQGVIVQMGYWSRWQIQADISIGPGSSGGPLLDRDGCVIGVIASSYADDKRFSFAVQAQALRRLAERATTPSSLHSNTRAP